MNYAEINKIVKDQPHALIRMSTEPGLDQARGVIEGYTSVNKYGRNLDVDSGAYEPIVESGVLNFIASGAADEVRVKVGGNSADAAAGTGAREVQVQGIDENLDIASATITMNADGTLASALTTTKFLRIFRAKVTKAGSGEVNAGDIVIETEGGTELLTIAAGLGQSQQAHYTTPRNHSAYIKVLRMFVPSTFGVDFRLIFRGAIDAADLSQLVAREYPGVQGTLLVEFDPPLRVPEKTDFWVAGLGENLNQEANAEFDFVLVDES